MRNRHATRNFQTCGKAKRYLEAALVARASSVAATLSKADAPTPEHAEPLPCKQRREPRSRSITCRGAHACKLIKSAVRLRPEFQA
jgi:hypothetical protein